ADARSRGGEASRFPSGRAHRQDEPESRTVRNGRLVRQRATVCPCEGLPDGETESGAFARVRRPAREAFEEAADELLGDARAAILDRHTELVVASFSPDGDRRRSVAEGVCEEIRNDPV